jgi:hypothetical protein
LPRVPDIEENDEMSQWIRVMLLALMLGIGGVGLAGCEREGPFEDAGEDIDDALD